MIDAYLYRVTTSLESALTHLRHLSQARLIWADAIYINQADDMEKTSQVNLMGHIYHSAEQWLIWLGDYGSKGFSDSEATSAFEIVELLGAGRHLNQLPLFDGLEVADRYARGFEAWAGIVFHPWWQRIWTV
jgi:Heterokaryon incompatibility protein (HET)